ncbi:hypothetical protein ACA910_011984 [Epithemia clementina (nom. ined.)]
MSAATTSMRYQFGDDAFGGGPPAATSTTSGTAPLPRPPNHRRSLSSNSETQSLAYSSVASSSGIHSTMGDSIDSSGLAGLRRGVLEDDYHNNNSSNSKELAAYMARTNHSGNHHKRHNQLKQEDRSVADSKSSRSLAYSTETESAMNSSAQDSLQGTDFMESDLGQPSDSNKNDSNNFSWPGSSDGGGIFLGWDQKDKAGADKALLAKQQQQQLGKDNTNPKARRDPSSSSEESISASDSAVKFFQAEHTADFSVASVAKLKEDKKRQLREEKKKRRTAAADPKQSSPSDPTANPAPTTPQRGQTNNNNHQAVVTPESANATSSNSRSNSPMNPPQRPPKRGKNSGAKQQSENHQDEGEDVWYTKLFLLCFPTTMAKSTVIAT